MNDIQLKPNSPRQRNGVSPMGNRGQSITSSHSIAINRVNPLQYMDTKGNGEKYRKDNRKANPLALTCSCNGTGRVIRQVGGVHEGWGDIWCDIQDDTMPCPGVNGFPCVFTREAEIQAELLAIEAQLVDESLNLKLLSKEEWQLMFKMRALA
jgi:hypothetical protein